MNVALKMSTELLLSCWVCSQEGRNHCSKAGVNVPLLQRQLSLKLENQGRWYLQGNKDIIITTPNWPVTFHSSGLPYSLHWHQPRSSQTELCPRSLSPRSSPLPHPLKVFLISFYCAALADINPPAQGASEPPTEGGPSGQVESKQRRRRIYASSHLCRLSVASTPGCFWRFDQNLPAPCQVCHHHLSHRSRLLKATRS